MSRTLLAAFLAVLAPVGDSDPLAGVGDERIDIELEAAPVEIVYRLMSDISGARIEVDPCVVGYVDVKLDGVTVRTVLEVLATTLHLEYGTDAAGDLVVTCAAADPETTTTFQLRGATPAEAFERLERGAKVEGCQGHEVDLDVQNASPSAVVAGLASELGARHRWQEGRLLVTCG